MSNQYRGYIACGLLLFGITTSFAAKVDFDGTLIEDACDVYQGMKRLN